MITKIRKRRTTREELTIEDKTIREQQNKHCFDKKWRIRRHWHPDFSGDSMVEHTVGEHGYKFNGIET